MEHLMAAIELSMFPDCSIFYTCAATARVARGAEPRLTRAAILESKAS